MGGEGSGGQVYDHCEGHVWVQKYEDQNDEVLFGRFVRWEELEN